MTQNIRGFIYYSASKVFFLDFCLIFMASPFFINKDFIFA